MTSTLKLLDLRYSFESQGKSMTKTIHGKVHGKIIELDENLGVADGQDLEVKVVSSTTTWGESLRRCAGALAEAYEKIGGSVVYYGKPHRPIYDAVLAGLKDAKRPLAIGDGLRTDIKGANDMGIDALFIADTVTSLGGIPVEIDNAGVDACYSATQKCLSFVPGLSPLSVSDRAMKAAASRRTPRTTIDPSGALTRDALP